MDREKELINSLQFKDTEVAYWEKAKEESDITIKKLESALKYERATNEMCDMKMKEAIHQEEMRKRIDADK